MNTIFSRFPRSPKNRARLKLAALIVAVLAAVAYLAPLAVTGFIGQDALKASIETELAKALGRPVSLRGPVHLTMLPWMGLRTGPVSVSNAPGFGDEPLLWVQAVDIGFDLLALARGRLTVDALGLEAPVLRLVRLEDGRNNWSALQGSGGGRPGIPLRGLRLIRATLVYRDERTGRDLTLNHVNLRTGRGEIFNFSVACDVTATSRNLEAKLTMMGQATMDASQENLFFEKAHLAGTVAAPAGQPTIERAGKEPLRAVLSSLVSLNTKSGALELSELKVNGGGAQLEGTVNVAGFKDETLALVSRLSIHGRREGQWAKFLGVELKSPGSGQAGEGPSLRAQPLGEEEPAARLDLSFGPGGWRIENLVAGDGQGQLKGRASFVDEELRFDLTARGFDTSLWKVRDSGGRWPLLDALRSVKTMRGSLRGFDLRVGDVRIAEAFGTFAGQDGAFRAYPVSVRTPEALFTGEMRIGQAAPEAGFAVSAQVAALSAAPAGDGKAPLVAAQTVVQGSLASTGLTAQVQVGLGDPAPGWRIPGLGEDWDRLWRTLGASTAKATLHVGPSSDQSDDWDSWTASNVDVKTQAAHLGGSLSSKAGRLEVDLSTDRLDVDRLLALAEKGEQESSEDFLAPMEGRVSVKKLVLKGLELDDLTLAGQVSPRMLKLNTVTATLGGGKVTATCDADAREGRRSLTAQAALSGVQAQALAQYLPAGVKLVGAVDGKVTVESAGKAGQPLWRSLRGQADLNLASGQVAWGAQGGRAATVWPFSRAGLSLRAVLHPASNPGQGPENVVADISGQLSADTLGALKRSRLDIHGQAGLDRNGRPLWYRQPKLESSLTLGLPFGRTHSTMACQTSGKFEADLDKGSFAYSDVDVRLAGASGRARVAGNSAQGGTALSGSVEFANLNPRDLAPRLGFSLPAKAGSTAWRRAGFSLEIGGTARELRLTNIRASLDDTLVTGSGVFVEGKPRLDLSIDVLNLDKLYPHNVKDDAATKLDDPFPLETLRSLDLDAKVKILRLVKDKLAWGDADIVMSAHGGKLTMRQQSVRFYGGTYYLDFQGDARGPQLRGSLELRIAGAQAYPFLMDLGEIDSVIRGTVEFALAVEGHGATERALRRTLSGTAQLRLSDGKLLLRDSSSPRPPLTLAQREAQTPPPPPPGADVVGFGRLSGTFAIRDGVALTRDAVLAGQELVVRGEGWVDLADERIDLALTAQLQGGGEAPLRISGPLYDPKLDIDRTKVISDKILGLFKSVLTLPGTIFDRIRRF